MSLASRLQAIFQDRRSDQRSRVLLSAHLRTESETVLAVLLNLSRAGAMMASVSPPPVDTVVTLICGGLEAEARVVWIKGYQFGLSFHRRIQERQLAAIVAIAGDKGSGR